MLEFWLSLTLETRKNWKQNTEQNTKMSNFHRTEQEHQFFLTEHRTEHKILSVLSSLIAVPFVPKVSGLDSNVNWERLMISTTNRHVSRVRRDTIAQRFLAIHNLEFCATVYLTWPNTEKIEPDNKKPSLCTTKYYPKDLERAIWYWLYHMVQMIWTL